MDHFCAPLSIKPQQKVKKNIVDYDYNDMIISDSKDLL